MAARPIGEILGPIMARLEAVAAFNAVLARCPTPEDRKGLIITAYSYGALDQEETRLLIEANMLEAA